MNPQPSQVRVPGKVILLGEHAVVYGQPAVALPLDRGVTVRCAPAERFVLSTPPSSGAAAVEEALASVATALGNPRVALSIESEIPLGAGLGSSAAVAVASTRALAAAAGRELPTAELLALAEGMERTFHGRPSGIDHTTCLVQLPLRFERGEPNRVETLRVPPFQWVVANSGPRLGNTREKVLGLRQAWEREPARLDPVFARIGELAHQGVSHLSAGSLPELGRLMDENQAILNELGLSTPAIDTVVAKMRERGAWGAKLTGAGGGGAVIGLHAEPAKLVRELEAAGIPAFVATWEGNA